MRRIERQFGKLLPNRECGDCTACCSAAAIAELDKPAGQDCIHCSTQGCSIYERRPGACRDFECGWKRLKILGENFRPDKSGVIVMLEMDAGAINPFDRLCIVARWLVDAPVFEGELSSRLARIFRRGNVPAFFSPFNSTQKYLIHPAPAIYNHIVHGTTAAGKAAAEVRRWRSLLPAFDPGV